MPLDKSVSNLPIPQMFPNVLKVRELGLSSVPDLDSIDIGSNHVFEMGCHGTAVNLRARARASDALGDIEDDAGEAILIDPDFLVIGDLSQFAAGIESAQALGAKRIEHQPDIGKLGRQVASDCATIKRCANEFGHLVEARNAVQMSVANVIGIFDLVYAGKLVADTSAGN